MAVQEPGRSAGSRPVTGHERSGRGYWATIALVVPAATAWWLWRSGSSSLFVDEAQSWFVASHGLGGLLSLAARQDLSPPGYALLLHLWLHIAPASSESWLRLPSVIAGAVLLAVIAWNALLVAGEAAALSAAVAGAVSPFIFTFAQQVRGYVFVMLAVAIAVLGVLRAEADERSQRAWLAVSVAAAAIGLALHYTAWLVLVPLGIYLCTAPSVSRRLKGLWVGLVTLSGVAWFPLLIHQMGYGHSRWLAQFGHATPAHVSEVFGGVFSGRLFRPSWRWEIGAAVVVVAAVICVVSLRRLDRPRRVMLVVGLSLAPPAALLLVTIAGHPALLLRYVAVAVPFMVIMLAVAFVALPGWSRLSAIGVVALAVWNTYATDQPSGRYRDYRGALRYVHDHSRPHDVVVLLGGKDEGVELDYYAPRLAAHDRVLLVDAPPHVSRSQALQPVHAFVRPPATIWLMTAGRVPAPDPPGYRAGQARVFTGVSPIWVGPLRPVTRKPAASAGRSAEAPASMRVADPDPRLLARVRRPCTEQGPDSDQHDPCEHEA